MTLMAVYLNRTTLITQLQCLGSLRSLVLMVFTVEKVGVGNCFIITFSVIYDDTYGRLSKEDNFHNLPV